MTSRTYQRCWSSNNLPLVVVLRSVARAHELVLSLIPRNNTTKVGAHGVDAIRGQRSVILHNKVGRVALKQVHQRHHQSLNPTKLYFQIGICNLSKI